MEARKPHKNEFPYDDFMAGEGIPIHREVIGVHDVTALPREPWPRMGGLGTFIQLNGTFESERGLYVVEIPSGGALEPEKHLYEEEVFVLKGRGVTEVWQGRGKKLTFEWGEGSVFAFPRNTWHRLYNAAAEPAIMLAVTTAPRIMNTLDDLDFVFNCEQDFDNLYAAGESYFSDAGLRTTEYWYNQVVWTTNFIPDAHRATVDPQEQKVAGGFLTGYRMGKHFPHGHISEWAAGRYHKAHYHGPGAILVGLEGEGYVLAWPAELGPRPYQAGHGDEVVKVQWGSKSIYSPPNAWYHQHFNSGATPARHIAVYGAQLPLGIYELYGDNEWKGYRSQNEGGTLIEYPEEDPQVRKDFEAILGQQGIPCQMPEVVYR